ncbi:hypothetical protein SAMN04488002_0192 [Litoreibacter janthinus]|uniref:Uncharacterized protein n=1 Tax=Litoreibacter janthinus TaxID=670154 RepID=A0A1I6FS31_9RHOB|nr:hypothetical protein SAMN04488002_0192 [Litoreibacter janthinus]
MLSLILDQLIPSFGFVAMSSSSMHAIVFGPEASAPMNSGMSKILTFFCITKAICDPNTCRMIRLSDAKNFNEIAPVSLQYKLTKSDA